jgi:hypothetical protein
VRTVEQKSPLTDPLVSRDRHNGFDSIPFYYRLTADA